MLNLARTIAHIDADCFFAAVELITRPELRGKPVLVCNRTDTRGIVLAATYEARPFGIRAGTPVFKAKKLCPHAIIIPSHSQLYQDTSRRLLQIFNTISPDVEMASIDEAYIDLTGVSLMHHSDYRGIAKMIQKRVENELGITVSIGIGQTKIIAKIASDFRKPGGLTIVTAEDREAFLKQIPLKNIPGVGRATQSLLTAGGFMTAYDITTSSLTPELLGIRGKDLQQELSGVMRSRVVSLSAKPQSLSNTRTFPDFSMDKNYIFSFSFELLSTLTRTLRSHGMKARTMYFFIMDKSFHSEGGNVKLPTYSDEDRVFIDVFKKIFHSLFKERTIYRKTGFSLHDLSHETTSQLSLFETSKENSNLEKALDQIYKKFGKKGITRGSLLLK